MPEQRERSGEMRPTPLQWYDVTIRVRMMPQDAPRFGYGLRQKLWDLGWTSVFGCGVLIDGIVITPAPPTENT